MAFEDFFDIPSFDYDGEKKKFIDNMNLLKTMDVAEQTFYKKWMEVQQYGDLINKSSVVKAKIWTPIDLDNEELTIKEINELNPTVEIIDDSNDTKTDWDMLRIFTHTMEFCNTPGRFIKLLVTDGNTDNKRYLGVLSVSSDVIAIKDRDDYLGWTTDSRLKGNKTINNSAIGSCIASVQPFGYNFLGGKLCAGLITTSVIRDLWKKQYNNVLAGMTTTSLYGSYSMYNSLKWWHKCGSSAGKMSIKPDDNVYNVWHQWIKENRKEEYDKSMTQKEGTNGPVTGAKNRVLSMIFRELGLKSSNYEHGFERGTYYAPFYENTKEFLDNKIDESQLKMKPLYKGDKDEVLNWWKPKAISRYQKLKSENKLSRDILYYNSMIGMSYEDAKTKFLGDVAR